MSLDLISQRPEGGIPQGCEDWRFVVQGAFPPPGAAKWGEMVWGTFVWSEVVWTDMTPSWRGLSWERGVDVPGERPKTGTATITLDNRDRQWSPWGEDATYYRPATLIRVVVYREDATDWIAQFTGEVETWTEGSEGNGADRWVTIELTETVGRLGLIDANELAVPVGVGEDAGARIDRLLEGAVWGYGFYNEAAPAFPLQSTKMSANRLAELHLTADSTDTYFRSHRSGTAMLEQVDPALHPSYSPPNTFRWGSMKWGEFTWSDPEISWYTARHSSVYYRSLELRPDKAALILPDISGRVTAQMVYDADSLVPANDPDLVRNDIRLASVGGTQQVAEDLPSQGRYGKRSYPRNDLITQHAADVMTIAERIRDRRAYKVLRVASVDLTARFGGGPAGTNMPALMVADVGDPVSVALPDYRGVSGHITGVRHEVVACTPERVDWRTTLNLDTADGFLPDAVYFTGSGTSPIVHLQSVPHSSIGFGGDVTIIVHVASDDWIGLDTFSIDTVRSDGTGLLWFRPDISGDLQVQWRDTGGVLRSKTTITHPLLDLPNGSWNFLAVTLDVDNGAGGHTARFWSTPGGATPYTLIETVTGAGVATRMTGTANVRLLRYSGGLASIRLSSGIGVGGAIGGTKVAEWVARAPNKTYTDTTGKLWTLSTTPDTPPFYWTFVT